MLQSHDQLNFHALMAPKINYLQMSSLFTIIVVVVVVLSTLPRSSQAAKYFLPIVKDEYMSQYYTTFTIGTPPVRVQSVIDVGNFYSWMACDGAGYTNSSTFRPISCDSPKCESYMHGFWACPDCSSADGQRPGCSGLHTCGAYAYTYWNGGAGAIGMVEDNITLSTGSGRFPSPLSKTSLPDFPVACVNDRDAGTVLKDLSRRTKGILTLAKTPMALQYQVSETLKVPNKFALCLPSSSSAHGAIHFGGRPYYVPPRRNDLSRYIVKIPLVTNYYNTIWSHFESDPSCEYHIKVRSIKVAGEPVRFNDDSLLDFNDFGAGGTKIHTLSYYTRMHTKIYKALIKVFAAKAEAMNIRRVDSVGPFGACFDSNTISDTNKTGPNVPYIDLIMENKSPVLHNMNARWRIYGAQAMVSVSKDVSCLAIVDSGEFMYDERPEGKAAIQIGGKQMEDTLVEIDLESSNLGVISSLQRLGTSCSQFNEL